MVICTVNSSYEIILRIQSPDLSRAVQENSIGMHSNCEPHLIHYGQSFDERLCARRLAEPADVLCERSRHPTGSPQ
jgi:hypothetical protein